jgi:hypothetical protein
LSARDRPQLDRDDLAPPVARYRARGRGEHETVELHFHETHAVRLITAPEERVEIANQRDERQQATLAGDAAKLAPGILALLRQRTRIDLQHAPARRGDRRDEARTPPAADATVGDHDRVRVARRADASERVVGQLEVRERNFGARDRRDVREVRIDRDLAMSEREHAVRCLPRSTMHRRLVRAVRALDQTEAAERTVFAQLAPFTAITDLDAVDGTPERVCGRIGEVLAVEVADQRARDRTQLVRDQHPQHEDFGSAQLEVCAKLIDRDRIRAGEAETRADRGFALQ